MSWRSIRRGELAAYPGPGTASRAVPAHPGHIPGSAARPAPAAPPGSAALQCHLPGEAPGTRSPPHSGLKTTSKALPLAPFLPDLPGTDPSEPHMEPGLRAAPGTRSGRAGARRASSARSLTGGCNTWVCKPIFYLIPREQVFKSIMRERTKGARLGFHSVPHGH